jgi:hypothetical protein
MDVALDANAILSLGLANPAFSSLRDYLQKTKSRLLLPEVVLEELVAQRRALITKAIKRGLESNKDLKGIVPDYNDKPLRKHLGSVDVEAAVAAYRAELETAADEVSVVKNRASDLMKMVRRLANRIPPASQAGEEARDVLIWLAVLQIAEKSEVAFVTGDKKAFGKDGKLKQELSDELKGMPEGVAVYEGLDAFLRVHHKRSSWVDEAWVKAQAESQLVDDAIERYIRGREDRLVMPSLDNDHAMFTGYALFVQVVQKNVQDFFVSDMLSGAMMVGVSLWAELEIEIEYEVMADVWSSKRSGPTTQLQMVYPTVVAQLQFEVAHRKLKSISVSDVERA